MPDLRPGVVPNKSFGTKIPAGAECIPKSQNESDQGPTADSPRYMYHTTNVSSTYLRARVLDQVFITKAPKCLKMKEVILGYLVRNYGVQVHIQVKMISNSSHTGTSSRQSILLVLTSRTMPYQAKVFFQHHFLVSHHPSDHRRISLYTF